MKQYLLQLLRIPMGLILLLFLAGIAIIILLWLPSIAFALRINQISRTSISLDNLSVISSRSVVASPTASSSNNPTPTSTPSQDIQDQRTLSEAQNDISIADTIIYWSQYELAGVAAVFAIIGFLGIREFSQFIRLRKESELRLQEVTNLEQRVEQQLQQVNTRSASETQRIENQYEQLTQLYTSQNQRFEEQREQFAKRFESESENFMQNFMDASYNFNLATNAYEVGDNVSAIEYYLQVLQLQPKNTRVMERLGRAYSNLNDLGKAIDYLEKALAIDSSYVPALRSLGLCYRYTDVDKAINYLNLALKIKSADHETWDFLGLIYRDNKLFDEAISAHTQALNLKRRPETQFYLSILYAIKGDAEGARAMSLNAKYDLRQKEHDERIRPVWKILIRAGVPLIEGNLDEAYRLIQSLTEYITTQRICDAVTGHLKFLLEATGHEDWIEKFTCILKVKETQNATA